MGPNGNPNNPNVVRQNLSAAERQASGDVGQICEICPDNWVEAGAIDETTGEPIPGIGYRIYDMASGDQVASGVLNEKGESPRHNIPTPVTQLYVMFGTQEAMDEAAEQIGERQRAHALEQNAVSEWRGIPSGLEETEFNRAYNQIARDAGRYEKPSVGLFEGAGYGANMLWDYVSSGFDSQHMLNELYLDDRRRNFEDYQLATNARRASDAESFVGGGGQGLTFGFGEEGMARLDTLFTDRSYEELVAERRQLMNAEQIANPNWFIGGEIAGAVPTIFVPIGGAAGRAVQAGRGTVGAIRSGATTGAVTGAVSGAGHDEGGVLDRLDGAALGAATGGMAGAVLSGAGVLIARGVAKTRIWGRVAGRRGIDQRLLDELRRNGVKHTPEDIVRIERLPDGRIVFLEQGSSKAGLQHIVEEHSMDFARRGIAEDDLPEFIFSSLREGRIAGYQGKGSGRPIYESYWRNETHRTAITTGKNGFIVGANPVRR